MIILEPNREEFDVVVVGCGPGGSVAATYLAEAGLRVLALERHAFPRYHIGESLTGTAGEILRELGLGPSMAAHEFPPKSGVKVIGSAAQSEFFVPVLNPTWQVRRDAFDQMLLQRAIAAGVTHRYGSVKRVLRRDDAVVGVAYKPTGSDADTLTEVLCDFVVDASGHSAVLSKHRVAGARRIDAFSRQMAAFTQLEHTVRDPGEMGDNTFIFYGHQLHWAWFIPLSRQRVSVGVVAPVATFKEHGSSPEDFMRWGLQEINPDLHRRVQDAVAVEPVRTISNYSYRIEPFVGDGWLCVGDAHRFTDPIFSFGVAFAMTEGRAAAEAILAARRQGGWTAPFARYAEFCTRGQDAASDLIRYFWRFPAFFAYQTRGKTRKEIIRLLAGDCFDVQELPALRGMRRSLCATPLAEAYNDNARTIAQRVYKRYADFQGVTAAYLDVSGDGIRVSFLLDEDAHDLHESLHDFEEGLYGEFGRERLAVLRWIDSEQFRGEIPSFASVQVVFDRRSA